MLFLARHGETEWNRDGRIQGRGDSPLTAKGECQARALARFTVAWGVTRLYASPLGRARATAAVVAAASGVAPGFDDRLREAAYGLAEGLTGAEIEARFPGALAARAAGRWDRALPGGETGAEVWDRAAAFAGERLAGVCEDAGMRVMVIAHQGVNRALAGVLGGLDPPSATAMAQPHGVVFACAADGVFCLRLETGESGGHASPR